MPYWHSLGEFAIPLSFVKYCHKYLNYMNKFLLSLLGAFGTVVAK
jgi:hypothetical protein